MNGTLLAVPEQTKFALVVTRSVRMYFFLMALITLFRPAELHADSVNGSMEFVCVPPPGLDIHLVKMRDDGTLVLHLFAARPKLLKAGAPLSATASWCASLNKCEEARGSVQFSHLNLKKKASGTYKLEFSDGRKTEGVFTVVRRHQHEPFLCE